MGWIHISFPVRMTRRRFISRMPAFPVCVIGVPHCLRILTPSFLGRRNAHDVLAGDSDLGLGPPGSGDLALRSLCAQHPVPGQPGAPHPRRKPGPAAATTGAGAVPAVK